MATNPDSQMAPADFLKQELLSDEDLEAEVRSDVAQEQSDEVERIINDHYGDKQTFVNYHKSDEEQEDDGQPDLEALQAKEQEQRDEALRCAAKLINQGEFGHLKIDDPVLFPIARRLYAQDTSQSMATLARRTLEKATSYRGMGKAVQQRKRAEYAQARNNRLEMMKRGGIQAKRKEDAAKFDAERG